MICNLGMLEINLGKVTVIEKNVYFEGKQLSKRI